MLGRVWNKLDAVCGSSDLTLLSSYIGFEEQPAEDDIPARQVLLTVNGLQLALQTQAKIPSKKSVLALLQQLQQILEWTQEQNGRVRFEVDF